MAKHKKKKKIDTSKIMCAIILAYGIITGILYYVAIFFDKMVDSSLATQCVITIIGSFASYCLYNFGLKNSRNKYGVDETGQPYRIKTEDYSEGME